MSEILEEKKEEWARIYDEMSSGSLSGEELDRRMEMFWGLSDPYGSLSRALPFTLWLINQATPGIVVDIRCHGYGGADITLHEGGLRSDEVRVYKRVASVSDIPFGVLHAWVQSRLEIIEEDWLLWGLRSITPGGDENED